MEFQVEALDTYFLDGILTQKLHEARSMSQTSFPMGGELAYLVVWMSRPPIFLLGQLIFCKTHQINSKVVSILPYEIPDCLVKMVTIALRESNILQVRTKEARESLPEIVCTFSMMKFKSLLYALPLRIKNFKYLLRDVVLQMPKES